jgi:hypothetical protein
VLRVVDDTTNASENCRSHRRHKRQQTQRKQKKPEAADMLPHKTSA